jgi:hypothetical protein
VFRTHLQQQLVEELLIQQQLDEELLLLQQLVKNVSQLVFCIGVAFSTLYVILKIIIL